MTSATSCSQSARYDPPVPQSMSLVPRRTGQRVPLAWQSLPARTTSTGTVATAAASTPQVEQAALEALQKMLFARTGGRKPWQLRLVGSWVAVSAAAVFLMVVLGGVTRLTRSGLSMVDWRPQGSRLPATDEEWEVEFAKYRAFPEFKLVNSVSQGNANINGCYGAAVRLCFEPPDACCPAVGLRFDAC